MEEKHIFLCSVSLQKKDTIFRNEQRIFKRFRILSEDAS